MDLPQNIGLASDASCPCRIIHGHRKHGCLPCEPLPPAKRAFVHDPICLIEGDLDDPAYQAFYRARSFGNNEELTPAALSVCQPYSAFSPFLVRGSMISSVAVPSLIRSDLSISLRIAWPILFWSNRRSLTSDMKINPVVC